MHRLFTSTLLMLALFAGVAQSQQRTIIPWGDSGYRYRLYTSPIPVVVYGPGFDDSDWDIGSAPFGNGTLCERSNVTLWPAQTAIVIRRRVSIDEVGLYLRWMTSVYSGDIGIYINGCDQGSPSTGPRCDYSTNRCLRAGENVIVVSCFPRGAINMLDLAVFADYVVSSSAGTWGRLKAVYR